MGGRPAPGLLPAILLKGEAQLSAEDRQRVRARLASLRPRQIEALETLMESPIPDILRHAGDPQDPTRPPLELDAARLLDRDASRGVEGS